MTGVFINSLPKSGTNLVSRAFDLAGYSYGKLGIASSLLIGNHYLLRQLLRRSFFERDPLIVGLEVQVPLRRNWLRSRLGRLSDRTYVTGHANHSAGLGSILREHDIRTVQVIRDPRDAIVSHAHYVKKSSDHFLHPAFAALPLWDRITMILDGGRLNGFDVAPYTTALARADGWIGQADVFVVRFEQIVGAAGGGSDDRQSATFRDLGAFLGRPFDLANIQANLFGTSHTFRRGMVSAARHELTAAQFEILNFRLGNFCTKWGYHAG